MCRISKAGNDAQTKKGELRYIKEREHTARRHLGVRETNLRAENKLLNLKRDMHTCTGDSAQEVSG